MQEYRAKDQSAIYHIDLYRLKNDQELEDSGIIHQIEEVNTIAMVEWPNLFEDSFSYWRKTGEGSASERTGAKRVIEVLIEQSVGEGLRNYQIHWLSD